MLNDVTTLFLKNGYFYFIINNDNKINIFLYKKINAKYNLEKLIYFFILILGKKIAKIFPLHIN